MSEPQQITYLTGWPFCPECDRGLSLRPMPGLNETHWYCERCGTQWLVGDLIAAINLNLNIAVAWALGEGTET